MKKQAINLGRIGILLPIAFIIPYPYLMGIAALGTLIFLLISFHNFSSYYETPGIFKNALVGFIIPLAGGIISTIIFAVTIASSALSRPYLQKIDDFINMFIKGSTGFIIAQIIMFAAYIIGFYLLFKAMKLLAEKSGIKTFKTAGLLYFITPIITLIILGIVMMILSSSSASPFLLFITLIGGICMLIGWILHIIAYFTFKTDKELQKQGSGPTEVEA
ncbi:MAG: DUF996 domain-containing protein [Bacteroidota bacterium]